MDTQTKTKEADFQDALAKVGKPRAVIEKEHRRDVSDFHRQTKPFREFAEAAIQTLQGFFHREVAPFVMEIEHQNINDSEIATRLDNLRVIMGKPNELRWHLRELERIGWEQIAQTVFPDQLDKPKRDALVRHFHARLVKIGDIVGAANSLMDQIRQRVMLLAQAGIKTGGSLPLSLPTHEKHADQVAVKRSVKRR